MSFKKFRGEHLLSGFDFRIHQGKCKVMFVVDNKTYISTIHYDENGSYFSNPVREYYLICKLKFHNQPVVGEYDDDVDGIDFVSLADNSSILNIKTKQTLYGRSFATFLYCPENLSIIREGYMDPTYKQQTVIKKIEEMLNVNFDGKSSVEASMFIAKHLQEYKNRSRPISSSQKMLIGMINDYDDSLIFAGECFKDAELFISENKHVIPFSEFDDEG